MDNAFCDGGRREKRCRDLIISTYLEPVFQAAFKQYFAELGVEVKDWDGLFREMSGDRGNITFLRLTESGSAVGFIQIKPIDFTSWFFEEKCGFIREFWIAKEHRGGGHGSQLLELAEEHFRTSGIYTAILTTDTAESFYERRGYARAPACRARNQMDVFVKRL